MLPPANHDEQSRESFVLSLKTHVSKNITPGNKVEMENVVVPKFRRENNRDPWSLKELRRAMNRNPYHQMWGSLMRTGQELMWISVVECVDRQIDAMTVAFNKKKKKLGGVKTSPNMKLPGYITAVDIHTMPGNYQTEAYPGDMRQGAIYDRGVHLYHHGSRATDDNGRLLVAFMNGEYPDHTINRVLEEGCSTGNSTTAFCDLYPDAEVHAIDLGAPMVRYAHARADAMGREIFFTQGNAEETDYPDNYFDLVVSTNMLHETSSKALPRIMRETMRILRPGGVMAHMEVPVRYADMELYDQVMRGWQTRNNGEPFWDKVCSTDTVEAVKAAGFERARDGYITRTLDPVNDPRRITNVASSDNMHRYILTGVKPA
jgi:ubiquinone/menaquinone biosynthesis C-methylase UbiE